MRRISETEALQMLKSKDFLDIGQVADSIRAKLHPERIVTFIIDRNINYTNICINRCRFCAFYRDESSPDAYVLDKKEIFKKISETINAGGTQILLQGGINPSLDLNYYCDLLSSIKERFRINIHGFSPPEIDYLSQRHNLSIKEVLIILKRAGLDSIPGGGAEILSDRVRKLISPRKINSAKWLNIMEEAHKIGMKTTATMMFGTIEDYEDIVEHLRVIRELQDKTNGFTAFIPWSFQPGNTQLKMIDKKISLKLATALDYLKILSISRIYLDNIKNIQASWVTQGVKLAQVALRFGANDFGSTMIEENVVRATGIDYRVSIDEIIQAIKSANFKAAQRDTYYNILKIL
ncbi:MAG: dehypoxanthine futalosine cyclase [Thermodesulfovibrionales bacterium]|nr:dehypoxanthine futalosine cyclase [Thermodesulfovibrionales bacterium]